MNKIATSRISPLLLILAAACPVRENPNTPADGAAPDDGAVPDRAPKLPPPERKGLGVSCSVPTECSSGFCVDGVCCDTACDATCFACNSPGTMGACTGLNTVEDPAGTPACAATRICVTDQSGMTACLSKDGEACTASVECAAGNCRTYYRDQDGDGYGAEAPDVITRCDATSRPPEGYAATGGDCCDLDSGAKPAMTAYFAARDRCSSYDWNCSSVEEKQTAASCPTTSGAALACGQACTIVLKGTPSVLFVQACH